MSLSTNLVSEWLMGEASGTRVDGIDSLDLTQHNNPDNAAGLVGNACRFTAASSQYLQAPTNTLGAAWSIDFWIKPSSTALGSDWARVFDWGTGTSLYVFHTVKSSSGSQGKGLPSIAVKYGGNEYQAGAINVPYVAGTWYHVLVTASSSRMTVYVNGVCTGGIQGRDASGTNLGSLTLPYVGKAQFSDPYYDGLMQYGHLWDRELTLQDAVALYNSGTPVASPFNGIVVGPAGTPNANGRAPYQMSTFTTASETLQLLEGYDGHYWTSYAVSYTPSGGAVCRDPAICYVTCGGSSNWYAPHTRSSTTSDSFYIAKATSGALTTWNTLVAVSGTGASLLIMWAPKFVRNSDNTVWLDGSGIPMIVFAASTSSTLPGTTFQLYYTQPNTSDQSQWGTAANWSTPVALTGSAIPANIIDPFIVFMSGSTFKMFAKNETTTKIQLLTTTSGGPTAGWNTISDDPGGWGSGMEGCTAFKIGSTWLITTDPYNQSPQQGMQYATSSDDLATITKYAGLSTNVLTRHGALAYVPPLLVGPLVGPNHLLENGPLIAGRLVGP